MKLAVLNELHKLVPFSVLQPNDVLIFADCYALVGDRDFGALFTQRHLDGLHFGLLPLDGGL